MKASDLDVSLIRCLTPGASDHIHFNNAGASLPMSTTLKAITDYLEEEAQWGGYSTQNLHETRIKGVYKAVAQLIKAQGHEVAITTNASAAFWRALTSISWQEGDVILCSPLAYGNNYLNFLFLKEKYKVDIQIIPTDEEGVPDPEAFEKNLPTGAKILALTHMPTNSGTVAPAEAFGEICRRKGILYLLDACQTVGQMPIDVNRISCDFLSATSRKYLRGPRGLGFLYVSDRVLDHVNPPFLDMNAAVWKSEESYELVKSARMYEEWEKSYALMVGMGEAAQFAHEIEKRQSWARIQRLAKSMRAELQKIPGVQVHDRGNKLGGIVSFSKEGFEAEKLKNHLQANQITTSITYASSSLLDMNRKGLATINRASLHYYNTEGEIAYFLSHLSKL